MSLEKQIIKIEKCLEHGDHRSQEYLILENQHEIMLVLQEIKNNKLSGKTGPG